MIENLLFETHFDIIPFDVYVVDITTFTIVYMNRHFKDRIGNFTGQCCHEALYESEKPCTFCKIGEIVSKEGKPNGKISIFEHFNEMDDHWYQVQEKAITWPDGRTVKYSIAVDISELKETQNRLAEAHAALALKSKELELHSVTDPLTGVYNRLRLNDSLYKEIKRSLRYGTPVAVILLDIDHFKAVNDTYGHPAGDRVLVDVARLITERIRETDIFGRWGGEEFMLICTETSARNAQGLAEQLRQTIEGHAFAGIGRCTASFGIAELGSEDTIEELIRRADDALYQAKKKGRNRVEGGGNA